MPVTTLTNFALDFLAELLFSSSLEADFKASPSISSFGELVNYYPFKSYYLTSIV